MGVRGVSSEPLANLGDRLVHSCRQTLEAPNHIVACNVGIPLSSRVQDGDGKDATAKVDTCGFQVLVMSFTKFFAEGHRGPLSVVNVNFEVLSTITSRTMSDTKAKLKASQEEMVRLVATRDEYQAELAKTQARPAEAEKVAPLPVVSSTMFTAPIGINFVQAFQDQIAVGAELQASDSYTQVANLQRPQVFVSCVFQAHANVELKRSDDVTLH